MTGKTYNFESETGRVLELLTNSIYSNKDIFLRELISNAGDAIDKARMKSLTDSEYLGDDSDFKIIVESSEDSNTITITDNGIGMTREEVISHIGTIAKSGTKDLLDKLKESKEAIENNLIGQFGVGFYSSFLVADKVTLETKSNDSDTGIIWESDGKGTYKLDKSEKNSRGTKITLHLRDEDKEYTKNWKLRELIKRHSNYIGVPIMLESIGDDKSGELDQVNETTPIWNKNKSELKDEDYSEFYTSVSNDFNKPLGYINTKVEGLLSYKSILFIPEQKNMFLSYEDPNIEYGPRLYTKNVLILEHAKNLLPIWLRFVSGIVETGDLPLNISREMLQSNPNLDKIQKGLTKKVLSELEKLLKNNSKYDTFLDNFSRILKEGIYYDKDNKERIAGVLKFKSLLKDKNITLDEYTESINSEKKEIYYILGRSESEVKINPYLEQFKEKNIDVLLLTDPIDEWVTQVLTEYKDIKILNITRSNIDLDESSEDEKKALEETKKDYKDLLELVKNTIGTDKLETVRLNTNIGDNIGALKTIEGGLTPHMEKIMRQASQPIPTQKRILELNPNNKIVKSMLDEFNSDIKSDRLKDLMRFSYDQAILLEGGEIEDIKSFLERVERFMM